MSISTNSVTAYGLTTYFELSWTETTNLTANTSTLSFTLTTRQDPSGSGYQRTINASGSQVVIDGTTYSISGTKAYDGLVIWSTSGVTITHNADGTKAINASIKVNVGGDYVSGSGTINLTTLQRVSPVTVSPSLLTSGSATITITPYVSTYKHTVTYTVGTTTKTLGTKTSTKTFTVTYATLEDIVGQYKSADVQVKCVTYNGTTELGTSYATFTVQTGKIPFSLYDDQNGNVGVTIGEQASGGGFKVMCDDVEFANYDWLPCNYNLVPNGDAAKVGYKIDGKDVYCKIMRISASWSSGTTYSYEHNIGTYSKAWIDYSRSYIDYSWATPTVGLFSAPLTYYGNAFVYIALWIKEDKIYARTSSSWNIYNDKYVTIFYY